MAIAPSFSSDNYYAIYDLPGSDLAQFVTDSDSNDFNQAESRALGYFTFMQGGSMTISTISYDVMDIKGYVTTKFIPGQIAFAPIQLARPLDNVSQVLYDWFVQAEKGILKDLRKDWSLAKINFKGEFEVIWDLIQAIPVAIPGFSYNSYRGSQSTKFKLTIQVEDIDIVWMYGAPYP